MPHLLRVTLRDGLCLPSGFVSPASYDCVIYCRVPDNWLLNEILRPEKQELLLQKMYGPTWRNGNEDGSRYVVLSITTDVLTPEQDQAGTWRASKHPKEGHLWFWKVNPDGIVTDAQAENL